MSNIFVFHEGRDNSGWMWNNVFEGSDWAGDQKVPYTGISAGASAVVYNGKIHAFHQGRGDSGWLWCNVFNGSDWAGDTEVPNTGIFGGPGAVVY